MGGGWIERGGGIKEGKGEGRELGKRMRGVIPCRRGTGKVIVEGKNW